MNGNAWWAAPGSAALLLALSLASSAVQAGEQTVCEGEYESYQCFELEEKDAQSVGDFYNNKTDPGKSRLRDLSSFSPPGEKDGEDRFKFGYVEAYFVPSESKKGYAGINKYSQDPVLFVYDGAFVGGDLSEDSIPKIRAFNENWPSPQDGQPYGSAPPFPNECGSTSKQKSCSQIFYDFTEDQVVTFVVSHWIDYKYDEFSRQPFPVSFFSSVAGDFYVNSEDIQGEEPATSKPDIDADGPYTVSSVESGETNPVFRGGTLSFVDGSTVTDKNFAVEDYEENKIDNAGKSVELSGILSGPGGMAYVGSGVTTLSGTAAYTGNTVVKEGTLSLKESTNTFDVASSSMDVQVGATLQLEAPLDNSAVFSVNSLSLRHGSSLNKLGNLASLSVKGDGLYTQGDVTIDVAIPDTKNPKIENGLHLNPSSWIGQGTIIKKGRGDLTIGCERQSDSECSSIGFSGEASYDYEGMINVNEGRLALYRASLPDASFDVSSESVLEVGLFRNGSYQGDGQEGSIAIGGLSGDGVVIIETDESSGGQNKVELQVGSANIDSTFLGVISGSAVGEGSADFAKIGSGTLALAGANSYEGKTTIRDGVLALANGSAIPQSSPTLVTGSGRLDLVNNLIGRGEFKIDQLSIEEGGRLFARASQPLVSETIVLKANAAGSANPGGIAVALKGRNEAPIRVTDKFNYQEGSLVVAAPATDDPEGLWKIIDGSVGNVNELALNTFLIVDDASQRSYAFAGLGEENAVMGPALYKGYLAEGSLDLVIAPKTQEELFCGLHPGDSDCEDGPDLNYPSPDLVGSFCPVGESFVDGECLSAGNDQPDLIGNELPDLIGIDLPNVGELPDKDDDGLPDVIDPKPEKPCKGDECLVGGDLPDKDDDGLPDVIDPKPEKPCDGEECLIGNNLPDTDDDGLPDLLDPDDDNDGIPDEKDPDDDGDGELDRLPGCEVGDDLCDIISDIEGDEDEAWEEEEEDAGEVIDALLDGLEEEEIDLPLSFDYGQLARLVGSGLAPRNVDAAGRGLALHNNLLVDTLFDRQPLRQFEELAAEEVVEGQSVVEEEEAVIEEAAPVQPLWLKTEDLSDGKAAEYLEGAVEGVEVADADAAVAIEVEEEAMVVEFDGVSLFDQQDDELDLAKRDGVSAWVKGFGGNSRADDSSILYNDYDLNAYGTSFGVDVALSETFQIGAYANYGDLNVHHRSGDTGGGSWNSEGWGGGLMAQYSTRHFYVQGLLGASEFSGEQSRNILQINDDLGGNTARGDKSVTSYLGALRIGAPFKTGGVVLEPQGQVVWTRNHEQGFSETGGTEKNLRLKYKSRTTNFAGTELGMKLSVPIRTGDRGLLVPSLRAAWLADWNQANEGQEIGYKFTKKTANFDSQLGTENGALIEAGLDYTVQNFNGVSVKLYGRGGMEFWASDRGTTWRASGGVTFQF